LDWLNQCPFQIDPIWRRIQAMRLEEEEETAGIYPIDITFDVDLANRLAHLESFNKHYYRPNSYLHKWWARRCGTTFRAILKHLVTDGDGQDYYAPGDLDGRIILDPMIGGGTTLHEALRMGARVIGVDLDPIPVLQARATLTNYPLERLEKAFEKLIRVLRKELPRFFLTTCPVCAEEVESWYLLYGSRRFCSCGPLLMVDSLVLRQESDDTLIQICPYCKRLVDDFQSCVCGEKGPIQIVERGDSTCSVCGEIYVEDLTVPYFQRFEPLAVSGHCRRHKFFLKEPDAKLLELLAEADQLRTGLQLPREHFVVEPGRKSIELIRRGIDNYLDLFSSRQLLVLERAIASLPEDDRLERLNLALLISTSLEFNSMLCGYKGKGKRRSGAIRHTFAHHAYTFPITALENNPLYSRRASGTWQKLFHMRIRRARQWAELPRERDLNHKQATFVAIEGEIDGGVEVADYAELNSNKVRSSDLEAGQRRFLLKRGTATQLDLPDQSVDSIVTDPPYFDSVQYSDLSAFFRVWLQQLLPDEDGWDFDVRESAVDPHNNDRDSRYFELMSRIFAECARVLRRPQGRLIFTFHHWNPKAWAALTMALKEAGFHLLNYAVVHAEHPISVHIARMNALTHDAILVLAPNGESPSSKWHQPLEVDKSSSAAFCAGCAEHLGWTLSAELTAEQIHDHWQKALA
jgi:putative DNA methylase